LSRTSPENDPHDATHANALHHGPLLTSLHGLTDFPTSSVFGLDVAFPTCSDWTYMSGSRRVDTYLIHTA